MNNHNLNWIANFIWGIAHDVLRDRFPSLISLVCILATFASAQSVLKIDTAKVAVHILSGEYDTSGTLELGRAALQRNIEWFTR